MKSPEVNEETCSDFFEGPSCVTREQAVEDQLTQALDRPGPHVASSRLYAEALERRMLSVLCGPME